MATVNEKMTAIADAIRDKTGLENALTLDDMAADIPKVYDAGKQAEYDEFWDKLQRNGTRTNYAYTFARWTLDIFKPKYDMKVQNATYMFENFNSVNNVNSKENVDLVELLGEANVTIDFSECTSFQNWLMWANITHIGVIDCKSLTGEFRCYYAHQLKTIDKLILYEGNGTTFNWEGCNWLTNITIEGVIERAFDIHYTKRLTHESLFGKKVTTEEASSLPNTNVVELNGVYYYGGIIPALKDLTGSGKTLTLTIGSDNLAKLTDSEKAIATQKGWTLA